VTYQDHLIEVDADVAEEWGRLNVSDPLPVVDGLLAASAKIRGWTLVTRNTADLQRSGVALLNPFEPPATSTKQAGVAGGLLRSGVMAAVPVVQPWACLLHQSQTLPRQMRGHGAAGRAGARVSCRRIPLAESEAP